MAWDSEKPYAPFTVYKEGTIFYNRGERETMESFAFYTPTEKDIDDIWDKKVIPYSELRHGTDYPCLEFRAFRNVELNLTYEEFGRGRSSVLFWWRDENGCRYPMFIKEVDRLIKDGIMSNKLGGLWSAEKRGANYGIKLEKLLWRSAS